MKLENRFFILLALFFLPACIKDHIEPINQNREVWYIGQSNVKVRDVINYQYHESDTTYQDSMKVVYVSEDSLMFIGRYINLQFELDTTSNFYLKQNIGTAIQAKLIDPDSIWTQTYMWTSNGFPTFQHQFNGAKRK